MMATKTLFSKYVPGAPATIPHVFTVSGEQLKVEGVGELAFHITNSTTKEQHIFALVDVLHIPALQANLISIRGLDEKGIKTTFQSQKAILRHKGRFIACAVLDPHCKQYLLQY
jgi:hypothetical protein